MVKFYRTTLLALSAMMTLYASAINIVINAPGDNQVKAVIETDTGTETVVFNQGDNQLEVDNYTDMAVSGISPYQIMDVTDENGNRVDDFWGGATWYKYVTDMDQNKTFYIKTTNLEEARTASCTVTVDDPKLVTVELSGTRSAVTLSPGENTVKFDPVNEAQLSVKSKDYSALYRVAVDGTPIDIAYGGYSVPLSNGCNVEILANYPDIDVNLGFVFPEGCEDAFSAVNVDGEPVAFDGKSIIVKCGSDVSLFPNAAYEFSATSVTFNGKTVSRNYYGYYSVFVTDNSTVELTDITPLATYTATVRVSNPSQLRLYMGNDPDDNADEIKLNGTENTVKVLQRTPYLCWKAAPGCFIESVTANGNTITGNSVTVTDNMIIEFETAETVMDNTAYVWFDDYIADNFYFFNFNDNEGEPAMNIANGYTPLKFNDVMTPYSMRWFAAGGNKVGKVYINETEVENDEPYPGEGDFTINITNGDVLKVFLETEPEVCKVTFTNAAAAPVSVVRDMIIPVENFTDGFTAFKGTNISVTPADETPLTVTVNGTPIEASEGGAFEFVVSDETTNVVIADVESHDNFKISVDGITGGYAFATLIPSDPDVRYVWNCAEKSLYEPVGPEQVITNTVNAWREFSEMMGIDIAMIIQQMTESGTIERRIIGPLKPGTEYVVYAFALDADLNVVIPTHTCYFTTATPVASDNTFEAEVTKLEPGVSQTGKRCVTVTVNVTPTNNDPYTVFCLEKYEVDRIDLTHGSNSEKEFVADYVVRNALGHTYTGAQAIEIPEVKPNALMYAIIAGVDAGTASTPLKLIEFSTVDPEFEAVTVKVSNPTITDAKVVVTPYEPNRSFYWGVLTKKRVEEIGGAQNIYEKINIPYWKAQAEWYDWTWQQYAVADMSWFDVNGALCASAKLGPRKWDTEYVVYAYLLDEGANQVSPVYTAEFRTLPLNESDLKIDIQLLSVQSNEKYGSPDTSTAEFKVIPSDNTKPWAVYYGTDASDYDRYIDNPELGIDDFIYECFMPKVRKTYTGELEFGYGSVRAGKEYVVVCIGYDEAPNTQAFVMRYNHEGLIHGVKDSIDGIGNEVQVEIIAIPGGLVIDGEFESAEVYTLSGLKVATMTQNCLRGLAGGMYVVRVVTDGHVTTGKIMVR